jgi:hypothetical protein
VWQFAAPCHALNGLGVQSAKEAGRLSIRKKRFVNHSCCSLLLPKLAKCLCVPENSQNGELSVYVNLTAARLVTPLLATFTCPPGLLHDVAGVHGVHGVHTFSHYVSPQAYVLVVVSVVWLIDTLRSGHLDTTEPHTDIHPRAALSFTLCALPVPPAPHILNVGLVPQLPEYRVRLAVSA